MSNAGMGAVLPARSWRRGSRPLVMPIGPVAAATAPSASSTPPALQVTDTRDVAIQLRDQEGHARQHAGQVGLTARVRLGEQSLGMSPDGSDLDAALSGNVG